MDVDVYKASLYRFFSHMDKLQVPIFSRNFANVLISIEIFYFYYTFFHVFTFLKHLMYAHVLERKGFIASYVLLLNYSWVKPVNISCKALINWQFIPIPKIITVMVNFMFLLSWAMGAQIFPQTLFCVFSWECRWD